YLCFFRFFLRSTDSTINGQTSTTIRPPKTSFFTEGRLHFLGISVILVGIFGAYYQLNKMRGVDVFNMKFKKDPASEFRRNMEEMRRKREEYDKLPREFRP
uniref:Uncharacterized protein n=1 Tax=Romanomermis culicivorax TaxID=13658 RepID=A0A915I626_ROMCU